MIKLISLLKEALPQKNTWYELTGKDIIDYKENLFKLINSSYKSVGGHHEFKSPEDFSNTDLTFWVAADVDDDPDIDSIDAGKHTRFGTKLTIGATDGTPLAKKYMLDKMIELAKTSGNYMEASHKIAQALDNASIPYIDDEDTIRTILNKNIKYLGDGYYERNIGGVPIKKRLYGHPLIRT